MWQKVKYWAGGLVAFFLILAASITWRRNRAASNAAIKIGEGKESDAAMAQRRETAGEILKRLDQQLGQPPAMVDRTPSEVEAELERRGHVKK